MFANQNVKIIVLLIIFAVIYEIYKRFFDSHRLDRKITKVPKQVKCIVKAPYCEEADIDGWALAYALMYFIIGLIVPHKYLIVVIATVGYEVVKPYFGQKPRYIINPLVGITGYAIGSFLSSK